MAELKLVGQHLSCQAAVGCQGIQPAYDDLLQTLIYGEAEEIFRVGQPECLRA